ncbi:MAG: MaoC family dehydratase [Acidimicrobiales bacterium]
MVGRPAPAVVPVEDLASRAGARLGTTAWRLISQEDVDAFARLTGDDQWIHVDPQRAKEGPFGATIAHGYFTLSLSTILLDEVVAVTGAGVVLNYGSNRVRYPAPVPTGSRLRAAVDLAEAEPVPGGVQAVYRLTYEVEGGSKPVCVADIVYRYYSALPSRG